MAQVNKPWAIKPEPRKRLVRLATLKSGAIFPHPTSPLGLLSLDHLVRPRQHVGGSRHADLPSSLEIDPQLKLRRLLNGQVGRRIDDRPAFFIADLVLEAIYHARGNCEKYYLRQKPTTFRRGKDQI
jgi:hypothetical protein